MPFNKEAYRSIREQLDRKNITLVAVSKTKPASDIQALHDLGHRDFGENYVQELAEKAEQLPKDIRWHFIGHLQSNKVKYIAPFVHLIHAADSLKLLQEINKQALKNNRIIDCLLEMHIAKEETKFGMNEEELNDVINQFGGLKMSNTRILGLMGMASFTDDIEKVRNEFHQLKVIFDRYAKMPIANCSLSILSMGMSSDYRIAVEEGSTMVRIGSLLFGERTPVK